MTPEPTHLAATASADRRQPMWPWLLLPLVTLTLFYVLFTLKASDPSPTNSAHHSEVATDSAPSESAESR